MAEWKLIAENVKYTRVLPKKAEFIADTYECTNCHNKVNNREPLPKVCPWCEARMKGGDSE